ncbi:uncharacterized protein LOC114300603 [Camellia sinensis]|uniref:uncharacterized protein LOC114300603 n=1 Tax=Camellia sinensis TaxID=4442 RepID=UPI001036599B|nr:uncharacterized protein LOC114300603 [Camellia sinensis]
MDLDIADFEPWQMWFDGSKANGLVGIGIVIKSLQGAKTRHGFRIDETTRSDDYAEYEALVMGLEILISLQAHVVDIFGNSQLVINQVKGVFKCPSVSLLPYYVVVVHLLSQFQVANATYIPRFMNDKANDVAQKGSNFKRGDNTQIDMSQATYQKLIQPLAGWGILVEANQSHLEEEDWRHPII